MAVGRRPPAASRAPRLPATALLLTAMLLVPAAALAQIPTQEVEYYHTDALGSVRAVTKQVDGQWQVVARHDFMPFGEEVVPPSPPPEKRLFTGKERDIETGLDYFEARYLRANLGRFTSSDPLMASQRISDPSSFNRYAYALNNPLRFLDPNGLDVSPACVEDLKCTIVVSIRLVFNTTANVSEGELRTAFAAWLDAARARFGAANILVRVGVETRGTGRLVGDKYVMTHNDPKQMNVWLSDQPAKKGAAGHSALDRQHGDAAVSAIGTSLANADTLPHELMHVFTGDPWNPPSSDGFVAGLQQRERDAKIAFYFGALSELGPWVLGPAARQLVALDVRRGLEHRAFALEANAEAKKPRR
jgi:RHS repeat-associated protein